MADLGTARVSLTVDTREFEARMDAARRKTTGLGEDADAAFQKASGGVSRASTSLIKYLRNLNTTTDQQRLLNAAAAGVPVEIIDAARRAMEGNAKAIAEATANQARLNSLQQNAAAGVSSVNTIQQKLLAERAASEQLARARDDLLRTQQALNIAASIAANNNNTARLVAERQAVADLAQARQQLISSQQAENTAASIAAHDRMRQKLIDERKATEDLAASRTAFVDTLRRESGAIGKSRSDMLELAAAERGVTKEAAPFIAAIRAQEQALAKQHGQLSANTKEFNKYGLSAKQQVAAMRGVPAQITDIFVSLQGGQNPLTVLLQQGGQLKDMFGGIVPAVRALGSGVIGLVNPFTVAGAAAAGFLGLLGSAESKINSVNKALIFTGQAGNIYAAEINSLAVALDNISGVTKGEAVEALTAIASTGKIAADQYVDVARAALAMRVVTGKAIKETVDEYAQLARDPTSAILKLNEAENFLTLSIFERIKALQESGDIEAAAALATETRTASQIARAQEMRDSLGLLTGAWQDVKEGTGEALDEVSNYFTSLDSQLKSSLQSFGTYIRELQNGPFKQMANFVGALANQTPVGNYLIGRSLQLSAPKAPVADAQETAAKSAVLEQLKGLKDGNRAREERQKLEEEQIVNLYAQLGVSKADKQVQDALTASRKAYEAGNAKKGAGAARTIDNASSRAALQDIKDQLTEEQALLGRSRQVLQAEYAAKLVTADDYYKRTRDLMSQDTAAQERAIQAQIASLRARDVSGKDSIDTTREIGKLEAQLTKVREEAAAAGAVLTIQQTALNKARTDAIANYGDALSLETQALRDSVNAEIAAIGMGQKRAQQAQEIAQLVREQAQAERELALATMANPNEAADNEARLERLRAEFAERLRIKKDGFAAEAEAEADWLNGVSAGIENWLEATSDVAGQFEQITVNAMDRASDAIAQFALTGKMDIKAFLKDMLTEIIRFMAKQVVLNFLKSFAGGINVGTTTFAAKGGVFDGKAGLSKYSGTIVDKPTPFLFARGAGIMGEAGPEAILPLSRGPDGKLGVKAGGGVGSSERPQVNIEINVHGDGGNTTTATSTAQDYQKFAKRAAALVNYELDRAMLPGGKLWKRGVSA